MKSSRQDIKIFCKKLNDVDGYHTFWINKINYAKTCLTDKVAFNFLRLQIRYIIESCNINYHTRIFLEDTHEIAMMSWKMIFKREYDAK